MTRQSPTPRGWAVLALACREGLTIHAVARRLRIHPSTAKNHLAETYRRLGVNGIGQACYCLGLQDGRDGWRPDVPASRPDEV